MRLGTRTLYSATLVAVVLCVGSSREAKAQWEISAGGGVSFLSPGNRSDTVRALNNKAEVSGALSIRYSVIRLRAAYSSTHTDTLSYFPSNDTAAIKLPQWRANVDIHEPVNVSLGVAPHLSGESKIWAFYPFAALTFANYTLTQEAEDGVPTLFAGEARWLFGYQAGAGLSFVLPCRGGLFLEGEYHSTFTALDSVYGFRPSSFSLSAGISYTFSATEETETGDGR